MKLRQIHESFMSQKFREMLQSSGYFNKPGFQSNPLYDPNSGHDAGARSTGFTSNPVGVPTDPRHRKFMGMEKRPGAIRL